MQADQGKPRSIETFQLFSVEREAVAQLLTAAKHAHERDDWSLTAFSGFPTAMLFAPSEAHAGSLHYMFFPVAAKQRLHRHPGSRCIVMLGDVELLVHYGDADADADPVTATVTVPAMTLTALRLPPFLWHAFETRSRDGIGVLAVTFHEDDGVADPSAVGADLMESQTVYWSGAA